jgi:hypothetical protein
MLVACVREWAPCVSGRSKPCLYSERNRSRWRSETCPPRWRPRTSVFRRQEAAAGIARAVRRTASVCNLFPLVSNPRIDEGEGLPAPRAIPALRRRSGRILRCRILRRCGQYKQAFEPDGNLHGPIDSHYKLRTLKFTVLLVRSAGGFQVTTEEWPHGRPDRVVFSLP